MLPLALPLLVCLVEAQLSSWTVFDRVRTKSDLRFLTFVADVLHYETEPFLVCESPYLAEIMSTLFAFQL